MTKHSKSHSMFILFGLLIFSGISNLIPDDSLKPQLQLDDSINRPIINQGNQFGLGGGFQLNPFGFNPFQGININTPNGQNPLINTQGQVNQQQTLSVQNNMNQQQIGLGQQQSNNQVLLNQGQQGNQLFGNSPQFSGFNNNNIQNQQQQQLQQQQQQQQQLQQQQQQTLNQQQQQLNQQNHQNSNLHQQQQSIGPFKFSPSLKHHDISVSQNKVRAQLTGTYKIFMMDLSLGQQCKRGCTNQFKIIKNSGWMALGVCDKNRIIQNNLKWNQQKTGHGTYLLGSFGGSWSSLDQKKNDIMRSFKYTTNDILRITFSPRDQTIIFDKKGSNDTFTLQYDWRDQQLHLCGMFYYAGDQIQYIGTKFLQSLSNINDPYDDYTSIQFRLEKQLRNSKINIDRNDVRNIRTFFDNRIRSVRLIYRGSEDAFSAAAFHKKCDHIRNTLTLVQTNHGKKLGGYTPLPWDSSFTYGLDNTNRTFLFSLTHNEKLTLKSPQHAIYKHSSYGPTFGGGHDIVIRDKSNANQNSGCNVGHSYNYAFKSTEANNRLCGSSTFSTVQYEVYQVFFDDSFRDRRV